MVSDPPLVARLGNVSLFLKDGIIAQNALFSANKGWSLRHRNAAKHGETRGGRGDSSLTEFRQEARGDRLGGGGNVRSEKPWLRAVFAPAMRAT